MRKRIFLCLTIITAFMITLFAGCTGKSSDNDGKKSNHPVITMNAPSQNMSAFYDLVHEKYPEINLEIEPYNGQNPEAYTVSMRKSGNLPDLYFTSSYDPGHQLDEENFLNLAGYAFTDRFVQSRLREVTSDGKIYMLPLSYYAYGITYNKTLLDKNGWKLPQNLDEMEALKAEVEAAGYVFCRDQIQNPESGFQYFCNIADTAFLSTIDGMAWQKKFLSGETKVAQTPEMLESLKLLERWKKIGLLNGDGTPDNDTDTRMQMLEGNTLFLIGDSSNLNMDNQAKDEFRLMPYVSEDGNQNVFILKSACFVGLNMQLAEKDNETKLEDALHIMELLSTQEGIEALTPNQNDSRLFPLKDAVLSENNYYRDAIDEISTGHTAGYIYKGWENIVNFLGQRIIDFICGRAELEDIINAFDDNQYFIVDQISFFYSTADEVISMDNCAKMVGICFAQATGAEAALISTNPWRHDTNAVQMNADGVSGRLFQGSISDQEITSILPTGWKGNIMTVTLTGKQIKELAKKGYDRNGNGDPFPYVLVTKGNKELEDSITYTIPICGATKEVMEEGQITDSGVQGLQAAADYFFNLGPSFRNSDIVWE